MVRAHMSIMHRGAVTAREGQTRQLATRNFIAAVLFWLIIIKRTIIFGKLKYF